MGSVARRYSPQYTETCSQSADTTNHGDKMRYLILLLLLFSGVGEARELRLLEADSLYFETSRIYHNYDPYWDTIRYNYDAFGHRAGDSGEHWTYGVAIGFDLTMVQKGDFHWTWENRVTGNSTNRQFRSVAWDHTMDMRYGKISAFLSHRSEHLLDMAYPTPAYYPLFDAGGIRLHFLGD